MRAKALTQVFGFSGGSKINNVMKFQVAKGSPVLMYQVAGHGGSDSYGRIEARQAGDEDWVTVGYWSPETLQNVYVEESWKIPTCYVPKNVEVPVYAITLDVTEGEIEIRFEYESGAHGLSIFHVEIHTESDGALEFCHAKHEPSIKKKMENEIMEEAAPLGGTNGIQGNNLISIPQGMAALIFPYSNTTSATRITMEAAAVPQISSFQSTNPPSAPKLLDFGNAKVSMEVKVLAGDRIDGTVSTSGQWGPVTTCYTYNDWVKYRIPVPIPGNYQLVIRYAAADSRPVRILAHLANGEKRSLGVACNNTTGGWFMPNQKFEHLANVHFASGMSELILHIAPENPNYFPHISELKLVYLQNVDENIDNNYNFVTAEGVPIKL